VTTTTTPQQQLDQVGEILAEQRGSVIGSSGAVPKALTALAVVLIVGILAVILTNVIYHGAGIIGWDFLSSPPENGMETGGIFPAIFGTVALVFLMVIFVVPLGVLTAIYLQEYTGTNSRFGFLNIGRLCSHDIYMITEFHELII